MLISISHVTKYKYSQIARYSVQSLRLTPPSFVGQKVLAWKVNAPGIESATQFRDAFNNISHLTSITGDHTEIEVQAEGLVEVEDTAGVVQGLRETVPIPVFLRQTEKTEPDDAIRELSKLTHEGRLIDGLHALMHAIHDRVTYRIGVTGAFTSAAEALADGQGVCQDHAHIFISAARAADIPARYVNGYFLVDTDEPSEAHHAWAEAFISGLGWVGFDPANNICPTDHYVRLATGLDAVSAAPIRGNRRGGSEEELDVQVKVQQANSQQ